MNMFCARRSTVRICPSGTTIHPMRQPVIEKYFEKELTTQTSSEISSADTARSP